MLPNVQSTSSLKHVVTFALAALMLGGLALQAAAQAPSIMSRGDTIVTGFPGVTTPTPPIPSGNPVDETFIDVNGASMQIQRPQPAGPPAGQLVASPTVFSAPAKTVGEVFPITLDDQPAPNIYLGATSAFGLQIVAPDNDGDGRPERITHGQAGAAFMEGAWGQGGAPGSIYRVDGTTGAITLFTTIGANAGPGLGDVVFDRTSHQFFVSDLDTGLIYRLDSTGLIIDTFDHGANGRPNHALPAVADDNTTMDITNAAFDSENPATWGFTQAERRVGGMAMHGGRLYYAVAKPLQVWSIGINLDGSFANDARWELDVSGLASDNAISDMLFDAEGRMVLAQRGEQRGSYDYTVFAEPLKSSVVRYTREVPDDPTTPSTWVQTPEEYAIGFRPEGRNTDGGVALGYGYGAQGQLIDGTCGSYLWTTGESLRDNPALADQLAAGGPATVHGLQGNDHLFVRPANDPPFQSYFTDYDGQFSDQNQGHIGDVEIWAPCQGDSYGYGYIPPYFPPPPYVPPPVDGFNLRLDKQAEPKVCADGPAGYICQFTIRVTNTGPSPYAGPITVDDWLPTVPPAATVTFAPQPPWVCGATGPTSYECTMAPVYLFPGESVDLYVTVTLPANTDLCELPNVAQLIWQPGWGDADPTDDADYDTATVPNSKCGPPHGDRTNLKIIKRGLPTCLDRGANWGCLYGILVTNTGPGVYTGDIVIDDTLSVPDPIVFTLPAPWTCTNPGPVHTCTFPEASLPDGGGGHLDPGHSVMLLMGVLVPKAELEQADVCRVTNQAKITQAAGGSPMNLNPADDLSALVMSATPGPNCQPDDTHSDLTISKRGVGCYPYNPPGTTVPGANVAPGPSAWACLFAIQVHNVGPDDYAGPLTVKDTFIGFTPVAPSPVFAWPGTGGACAPDGGGGYDCSAALNIPKFTATPPLLVGVLVPGDGSVCEVTNQGQITAPPGGSQHNTNGGNDTAQATIHINSPQCVQPLSVQVCPVQSRMPDGSCCPDGGTWNGRACSNGEAPPPPPPPPTPPPSDACPAGTHGTPPDCVANTCPPRTHGTYPNCTPNVCPTGTHGTYPNCVANVCPKGTHGTYPNCVRNACPAGTHGTFPNCVPNVCPQGTHGRYPNCIANVCPKGTHGTYPDCVRNACPAGTHGIFPDCAPNVCPQGSVGTYPNCRKLPPIRLVCPQGTHGVYPDCAPNVCPKGTFGTYPNCVKRPTTGPVLQINPNLQLLAPAPKQEPVIK